MKKVFIFILIFFCLAIVCSDTSEAAKYNPDLTVSRVTVDAAGNNTGGFSIKNVGNRPTGQYEVLVYFKKMDGSYFKQLYRTGNQTKIYPNQTRHYANVFEGNTAVTGLVRVNPHQRFAELNYYNNARYFSMQKKQVLSYNITEGVRRYDPGLGYDVVNPTYNGTFDNGEYNPILGDPYIEGGNSSSVRYVNGIRLFPEIPESDPPPEPEGKVAIRGLDKYSVDEWRFYTRLVDTSGGMHTVSWDSVNQYYYAIPDTWTPAYLRLWCDYDYYQDYTDTLALNGLMSVEIDDVGVDSYHVVESISRYSVIQHILYEGDFDNGEYDPVLADPFHLYYDGREHYLNEIRIYFDYELPSAPPADPRELIVRGFNQTDNFYVEVEDEFYNVYAMTWNSTGSYYSWVNEYAPIAVYIDAVDYESVSSYQLLDSFQSIWVEYNGTNVTSYNVTEGHWFYRVYDDSFVELFTSTFNNGAYDPIQADPPYEGELTEYYYVNHLNLTLNLPTMPSSAISSLLIIKGPVHLDDPPEIHCNGTIRDMIWDQRKGYYFLYNAVGLVSMVLNVWNDDYWAYDLLDSFQNIIVEYLYMPRSWSWS